MFVQWVRKWLKERGFNFVGQQNAFSIAANADAVRDYILKFAEPHLSATLRLDRAGEAGLISGKRCGWTRNIGAARRLRENPI